MLSKEQFAKFLKKIEAAKQSGSVDLSLEEDLSLAIMNLVSLEEHFFFTGVKTKKSSYFDLLSQVRELRKALLKTMMPQNEGETWCISKHLLAATMRLFEVGTKLQAEGKKTDAQAMFDRAYQTYSLFWGIRLKLIDTSGLKSVLVKDQPWTLTDIVDRLVDCCGE